MTREELRQVINEALGDIAPEAVPTDIADDDDLREALDIDSIGFLELITALHERLGVNIPEIDYPGLRTRGGLLDYLARQPD
jgi:acyl carrier protein